MDPPFERTFGRPDKRPFGAPLFAVPGMGEALVADFSDGTLWSVTADRTRAEIRALALPRGDTLLDYETQFDRPGAFPGVLAGHAGDYSLRDGKLVASEPVGGFAKTTSTGHRVVVVDPDPLSYALRVEHIADGATVFEGRFAPVEGAAYVQALLNQALALLRPPLVSLAAFETGSVEDRAIAGGIAWDASPLFAAGARPRLLALHLALGVLLAGITLVRHRKLGFAWWIVAASVLVTCAFGVVAFAWLFLLEPTRRARVAPAPREELALEPLIQTA